MDSWYDINIISPKWQSTFKPMLLLFICSSCFVIYISYYEKRSIVNLIFIFFSIFSIFLHQGWNTTKHVSDSDSTLILSSQKCYCCLVAQLCLTLRDTMDCNLSGSYVLGIFQARTLECVTISYSRISYPLRDRACISCFSGPILCQCINPTLVPYL